VGAASGIAALTAQGRLDPARGDVLELGEPLEPAVGAPSPSAVLEDLRADER
jgi:hypothetical protein